MGTKQIVFDPNPPYMGCDSQISRESEEELKEELKKYQTGEFVVEEKLDGQWVALHLKHGKVQHQISRGGIDKEYEPLANHRFPDISGILVGETSYGSSNPRMLRKTAVIYDFVNIEKHGGLTHWTADGCGMTNAERRKVLESIGGWTDKVCLAERRFGEFFKFYKEVVEDGGEGLIIKKLHGAETVYVPESRSKHWTKVKKEIDVDEVVMELIYRNASEMSDLTKSKGMENFVKDLVVGQYINGKLKKTHKVGSMSDEARTWFTNNPKKAIGQIVVIHGFGQFSNGAVRHPSIKQNPDGTFLRTDIRKEDCILGKIRYL